MDPAQKFEKVVEAGVVGFAEQLLDHGARHDILDFEGTRRTKLRDPATALEYARARKNPKMAKFLETKIAARGPAR
jgi:hypothetical protein